jgi:hypothetical protein
VVLEVFQRVLKNQVWSQAGPRDPSRESVKRFWSPNGEAVYSKTRFWGWPGGVRGGAGGIIGGFKIYI